MCHISTKMEQPFYHDDSFLSAYGNPDAVTLRDYKLLKQSMSTSFVEPYRNFKSDFYPTGSADAGSLKLASPELERLIAQSGGGVITSPTPGQYHLYGRSITEEQEGFADGFVKALDELHKMNQVAPPNVSLGAGGVPPCAPPDAPVYATLNSCSPNTSVQQAAAPSTYPSATISYLPHHHQYHHPHQQHQQQPHHHHHHHPHHPHHPFPHALHAPRISALKEEPQIVPDVHGACADGSPPTSPVDMENQERMKAERKRLRNRLAATKCRRRKLERISRLEDKVKVLKTDNAGLSNTASMLREQVAQLKQKVMTHVSSGCQLMLTPKIKSY